eukprot:TRINITY_DN4616_c1_g1_i1.p1 TRINITY_DN4616_c1_g1~~TRINITY_DN4616_c1_g1_i1.p1  ORF type:complete len:730 (+),score=134.47 TRINITY_DN4616_c1_g1_i1:141-2192(+)
MMMQGAVAGEKLLTTKNVKKTSAVELTKERIRGMMEHALDKEGGHASTVEKFVLQHEIYKKMNKAVKNWNLEDWLLRSWIESVQDNKSDIFLSAVDVLRRTRTEANLSILSRIHNAIISLPGWETSFFLTVQQESEKYLIGRSAMRQQQHQQHNQRISHYTHAILAKERQVLEASLSKLKEERPDLFNKIIKTCNRCFISGLESDLVEEARELLKKREMEAFTNIIEILQDGRPETVRNVEEMITSEIVSEGKSILRKFRHDGLTRKIDGAQCLSSLIILDETCRADIKSEKLHPAITAAMNQICDTRSSDESSLRSSGNFITCSELLSVAINKFATNRSNPRSKKGLITLINYVGDQVVFSEKLRRDLAKRLLHHDTIKAEEEILNLMNEVQVSPKVQLSYRTMLNDKKDREKINKQFREHKKDIGEDMTFELDVFLITGRSWPSFRDSIFDPPPPLSDTCKSFSNWWETLNANRHIKWLVSVGTMVMVYNESTELNLTTSQGVVLLNFNDSEALTAGQLCEKSQSNRSTTDRILRSLVSGGVLKVSREPEEDTLYCDSDTFTVVAPDKGNLSLSPPILSTNQLKKRKVENHATRKVRAAILSILKTAPDGVHETELANRTLASLSQFQTPHNRMSIDGIPHMIRNLVQCDIIKRSEEDPQILQLTWDSPKECSPKKGFEKE